MRNPFEFGRELDPAELVDREEEVAEVVRTIESGGKLFLIGPRRYGKTSILRAAEQRFEASEAVVLRFDAEAYATLELLTRAIFLEASQRLHGNLAQTKSSLGKFFSRLKPELSVNLGDQTISGSLELKASEPDPVPLLVDMLNGLEKLAAAAKRPVGLMLDEFQKVILLGGESAEAQIRAAIQRHRNVGYVFTGSQTRMLTDMTTLPSRPFYRLGERRFLDLIPRQDFADFLAYGFKRGGFKTTSDGINAILDLAEEIPYLVQKLAHTCWNSLQQSRQQTLTAQFVQRALELLARRDDAYYGRLWNELTVIQQKALLVILQEGTARLHSQAVTKSYGLTASTMQRALKSLQEKEVLRTETRLGEARLRFEDPFFKVWIRLITR
ncbi:MAG: AAA family ATPase [Blastocatellia bacterium]